MRTIDRPVTIQRINEVTEAWEDLYKIHASINKTRKDNEYLSAGAIQGKKTLTLSRYDISQISRIYLTTYSLIGLCTRGFRLTLWIMTIIC